MQIKFKHISISNFCGIKQLDTPLYDRTTIKGQNTVGKSTIRNAIFWVLYNKLADGSAPDGIRPHDENGVDIDFIDIAVILTIEVDGREVALKKVQKQKWTKPRNEQEKRFDGNINEFEINDIPKKEKDYKDYIDNIIPVETLMYCTNAMVFLGMDAKKRRTKLLSLEEEFSDADVVATDKKYAPLADMLMDGTIDELIARSKKVIKAKNDELKTIPARIDELQKQKVDIDVAELELGRNAIKEQIAGNKAKQDDVSKQYEEIQKAGDRILELQFELNDLQIKANEGLGKQKKDIETEIQSVEHSINVHGRTITLGNDKIFILEKDNERYKKEIQNCRDEWTTISNLKFDENKLICSYCGQEYPPERKEQIRADFEEERASDLAQVTEDGNSWKKRIDDNKAEIEKVQGTVNIATAQKELAEKRLKELEEELNKLPSSIDISGTEEYKAIQSQIAEKEQAMRGGNSADEIRQQLKAEESELRERLTEIERQIAKSENNAKLDERISVLQLDQREIAQKIADEEKTLDLLEDFSRTKVNLLTDRVNQHFDIVRWQMYKELYNGGLEQVCNPLIDGTSYYSTLNHGNKILAEIDICRAFQKSAGVQVPIFVDDAESVDGWRIPQMDNQLIILKRTDDKSLTIEVE